MLSLPLGLTVETPCGYLEHRSSQSLVVQSGFSMDTAVYAQLLAQGFRRSGNQVYRPYCRGCEACVPVRVPVATFEANRRQRRCIKRNFHTQVIIKPAFFDERHFQLYRHYQVARHDKNHVNEVERDEYWQFFTSDWCDTLFVEFLIEGELAAVAVVDELETAFSAVYTFFDPRFNDYSPGVFAVLWQIEEARRRGLDAVYLGFWIKDCRKMRYKNQYQPLSGFIGGQWQMLSNQSSKEE